MSEHTWYRRGDPGAPEPGDIVVSRKWPAGHRLCRVLPTPPDWVKEYWCCQTMGRGGVFNTTHLRRPTEEELATWALAHPGGAP